MKVIVRDDDTCGFTQVDELNACYTDIWGEIPISLSVTPYRIPGTDRNLTGELAGSMDIMPLHENVELVDFLRRSLQDGQVDVSMHGYHHLRYNGLPEYVGGSDLERKTLEGKAYLDNLLSTSVVTFVPPNNVISLDAIGVVTKAGMNLVNVPSIWGRVFHGGRMPDVSQLLEFYLHRKVRNRQYRYILDMGNHKEVGFHTVGPRSKRKMLFEEMNYCHERDGVFVLAAHYHAFPRKTDDGESVKTLLFDLIDKAVGMSGVEFVGINSIW